MKSGYKILFEAAASMAEAMARAAAEKPPRTREEAERFFKEMPRHVFDEAMRGDGFEASAREQDARKHQRRVARAAEKLDRMVAAYKHNRGKAFEQVDTVLADKANSRRGALEQKLKQVASQISSSYSLFANRLETGSAEEGRKQALETLTREMARRRGDWARGAGWIDGACDDILQRLHFSVTAEFDRMARAAQGLPESESTLFVRGEQAEHARIDALLPRLRARAREIEAELDIAAQARFVEFEAQVVADLKDIYSSGIPELRPDPRPSTMAEFDAMPAAADGSRARVIEIEAATPFADLQARYVKPAIALVRPYPPHRKAASRSRIGGWPDLPESVEWPRSAHSGLPLHFVAQIDLAELPDLTRSELNGSLPSAGTLLFFAPFSEEMLVDEESGTPLIVFDPDSRGVETLPPEDLPALDPRDTGYDEDTGKDGTMRVFPRWPIDAVLIASLPDPLAFSDNAYSEPRYTDYCARLPLFREEQIFRATGRKPSSDPHWPNLQLYADKAHGEQPKLRPHGETGFPWVARLVVLITRNLLRREFRKSSAALDADLAAWRDRYAPMPAHTPLDADEAERFIARLDGMLTADYREVDAKDGRRLKVSNKHVTQAIDVAVHRLITEAGASPDLARALPDWLYAVAGSRHAPLHGSGSNQRVRHMQMFGYVPAAQIPLNADTGEITLLQVQTDYGADITIGDAGELDFRISAEALARGDWSKVSLSHLGH